jgi:thiol-disulfide isomerase/thioredoxin
MKKKSFLIGYLVAILIGIPIALIGLYSSSVTPPIALNDFTFTDLAGNQIKEEDLRNKVIVLNIWATWCPPCVKEMPNLIETKKLLEGENPNINFIIASDEEIDRILKCKEKRKIQSNLYNFILKDTSVHINGRPATYFFNKDGEIVYSRYGAFDWSNEAVITKLRALL